MVQRRTDVMTLVRRVFALVVAMQIGVAGVVVILIVTGPPEADIGIPVAVVAAGVAIYGVASLAMFQRRLLSRPLDCTTDARLAASYAVRFYLGVASADAVTLIGFVGFFLTGSAIPFVVGLVIGGFGLRRVAPTATNLTRDQDDLATQGCSRSLLDALSTVRPSNPIDP